MFEKQVTPPQHLPKYIVRCPICGGGRVVWSRIPPTNTKPCLTCRRRAASAEINAKISRSEDLLKRYETISCDLGSTCSIIKAHHTLLEDDPERLTSEFIIGMTCGEKGIEKYHAKKVKSGDI